MLCGSCRNVFIEGTCLTCGVHKLYAAEIAAAYQQGRADALAWQPMETAPRNTEILLSERRHVSEGCGFLDFHGAQCWADATGQRLEPIAWMPLPKPPGAVDG
jgi:hypothetical protein